MTIAEIKAQMTGAFTADENVRQRYNLQEGRTFEEQFSRVSLENIIFSIAATAIWLNSKLFDQHKTDVTNILAENKAHKPSWYATRAKEFRFGYELVPQTDRYDDAGLTAEEVEASQVVKFAAAVEASDQSVLFIKTATLANGEKRPLPEIQTIALNEYLLRIKDAGVRISLINATADDLRLRMDIYYDPLILGRDGRRLDGTGDSPVQDAIREYLGDLDFNGAYTNQALVDKLQGVQGVVIAELLQASSRYGAQVNYTPINARSIPYAGYYTVSDSNLILNFKANG